MTTVTVTKHDLDNPLFVLKDSVGKLIRFSKTTNGGAVLFYGTSAFILESMSAAGITSLLATIGLGHMWLGIILFAVGSKVLPKLWAYFWSLF